MDIRELKFELLGYWNWKWCQLLKKKISLNIFFFFLYTYFSGSNDEKYGYLETWDDSKHIQVYTTHAQLEFRTKKFITKNWGQHTNKEEDEANTLDRA